MKIDVIIPSYNTAHFIREAIYSVQHQTRTPEKIIVVDDGSTDDTETIVHTLKSNSIIPLLYIKKENGGPNSARNVGLTYATAELVAFLDADDRWEPTKLEQQITLFECDTEGTLGLLYGNYKNIDTHGNDRPDIPTVALDTNIRGNAFARLLPGNRILGSASNVLIRRSVFETVGVFNETLRIGEDWDMWLRISEKYRIDYVDKILVAIRRHKNNQTNNKEKLLRGDIAFIEVWAPKIRGIYSIPQEWADRIAFNIVRDLPKLRLLTIARVTLSPLVQKEVFRDTHGSIGLYCILFLIRTCTNTRLRSRLFSKLKHYVFQ